MLTAEANEVNMKRNKKMMMPDDIATALEVRTDHRRRGPFPLPVTGTMTHILRR